MNDFKDVNLFTEIMQEGGWLMIPIGICLLLMLTITIERLVNLRLPKYLDQELLDKMRSHLTNGDFAAALQVCRSKNIMFNRLIETAIVYRELEITELRALLEDQSRQEASILERFMTVLRTIGTIAPLLGLLGTVAGMIKVFQTMSAVGLGEIGGLSGGISEALITTAAGMSVAIPTIIVHNFFERRTAKILLVMEKRMIELILLLRSKHAVSA
jgi:biopolymer transport protein ExbB